MKNTPSQISRKASDSRADRVSTALQTPRYELIQLGVDSHGGQCTFARKLDHLEIQPAQKLAPEKFLDFLKKQMGLAKRVVMVYEAGPYGFALYRQARELGVECLVCAPERLSRGRKRVNDKIDATELLNRLDRHLAGNSAALHLVRVPTIQQEIDRRLARERNTYRKERQRWISRGRGCLHTWGISRPGPWWKPMHYAQVLDRMGDRWGKAVQEAVGQELSRYLELIALASAKLEELTARLEKASAQKKQPRIRGIGPLSSELLDREVGDWNRFSNRRQVASYTGLCPGEDSSGDSQMSLSIDKHGNPHLRAVLVEAAWLLPKYQPGYTRLRRWKAVLLHGSKAQRKKAVVALARQLAVDLWRIKTGRVKPQDLGLKLAA